MPVKCPNHHGRYGGVVGCAYCEGRILYKEPASSPRPESLVEALVRIADALEVANTIKERARGASRWARKR
jgi:hypothetical protein